MEPIDTVEYMRTIRNLNSLLPKGYDQDFLCLIQKRGIQLYFFLFVLLFIELKSCVTSFLGLLPIVEFVKMIPTHANEKPSTLWSLFQCQSAVAILLHECFIRLFSCILILGLSKSF